VQVRHGFVISKVNDDVNRECRAWAVEASLPDIRVSKELEGMPRITAGQERTTP
jgi:hypothetical protein